MRYKFRGKRLDNGEWVYGFYLETQMSGVFILGSEIETKKRKDGITMRDKLWQHEVLPESVGQWTGLTDKNGKDIYEGDVVESHSELIRVCGAKPTGEVVTSRSEIVWNDFSWAKKEIYDSRWTRSWSNSGNVYNLIVNTLSVYYEVIGNIHDNTELMEVNNESY